MPPPGYQQFLRAICDNPADDAPRLVYADWLDEHGDAERAEFIRVQVARAQARARGEDPPELADRDRALRQAKEIRWRCELPVLSGVIWQRFWRGFVSGADVAKGKWFTANATSAFAATPIQFLRVYDLGDRHAVSFAACRFLERLEGLALVDRAAQVGLTGWGEIVGSPHLSRLRWLTIAREQPARFGHLPPPEDWPVLSRESAAAIAASHLANDLERLHVIGPLTIWVAEELRQRFGPRFRHSDPVRG